MYNPNDIANLRIQLHMFVYPKMIDELLNNIPNYCGGPGNIRYLEYDASFKRISINGSEQLSTEMIKENFKNLFSNFLRDARVSDILKSSISEESYSLYLEMSSSRDIYQYMFNITNCINNGCIVQL